MTWYLNPTKPLNQDAIAAAAARQNMLTKPTGALGQMEAVVISLAGMQGEQKPRADKLFIATFAGDHGICAEGVSAYPQAVTRQMLANFVTGGACISVMARHFGAINEVVNCGTLGNEALAGVINAPVGEQTHNFLVQPAMSDAQLEQALNIGKDSVARAIAAGADIYIAGEMGIGNTTASSALAAILLDKSAAELTGRGTGIDDAILLHKTQVVDQAKRLYQDSRTDALAALKNVGGFEMAAMVGAYLAAAQAGLPVIVGGFISAVCALAAVRINGGVRDYLLFSHCSAESGNAAVLDALDAAVLLDIGLRLGEGTGATTAFGIIQLACVVHRDMATFDEAGVSDKA